MPSAATFSNVQHVNLTERLRLDHLVVPGPVEPLRRRDWALAGFLAALVAVEIVLRFVMDNELDWPLWSLLPAFVAIGGVVFRRRLGAVPLLATLAAEAAFWVVGEVADKELETTLGHDFATIVLLYALCRWAALRQVAIGLTISACVFVAFELLSGESGLVSLGVLIPWLVIALVGIAMRYRAMLLEQQRKQARLEERNALARELHDTVAHHVSAIAVQAQAAQFVAESDPAAASSAMRAVEEIAATAIDDMRRMVGILRSDEDRGRTVAPPSLAALSELPGSPAVTLIGETDLGQLPASVGGTVFRIAQEAITNARRHSNGATFIDVDLRQEKDVIELIIENDGTPTQRNSGSGYGLIGMRERVESLDGQLDAGPRPASGWKVAATIPLRRGTDGDER